MYGDYSVLNLIEAQASCYVCDYSTYVRSILAMKHYGKTRKYRK